MIKFFRLKHFNKILNSVWISLFLISFLMLFVEVAKTFFPSSNLIYRFIDSSSIAINIFVSIAIAPLITFGVSKRNKEVNAFFAVVFTVLFESVFESIASVQGGVFVGIFVGFLTAIIFNLFTNYKLTIVLIFLITFIVAIAFGFFYDYYYNFLLYLSESIIKINISPFLFALLKPILELFIGGNEFSSMFFKNSFGGTAIVNSGIITGAKDIFEYQVFNGIRIGDYASKYLCGNYITSVFITTGFSLSIFPFINKKEKEFKFFLAISILTILSGNLVAFYLLLVLLNPVLLLAFAIVSGLSYLFLSFLYVNIGYMNFGGLLEFFKYVNTVPNRSIIFFLVSSVVFLVLSFSFSRLIIKKFGVSTQINNSIINSNVVKKLGGIKNIKSFKSKKGRIYIIVKNGNLVNTTLQNDYFCDINGENIVFKFKNYEQYNKFYSSISLINDYI